MNAGPLAAAAALDLTVAVGPDGRSRIAARRAAFPWSLGRGYPGPPGAAVEVIPQVAGAGLLAGDAVRQAVRVGPGAALRLTSAGAMLVHGDAEGREARSDWRMEAGPGAVLVVASEPHALLAGAALDLAQTLVIDAGARFAGFEGVCRAGPGGAWRTRSLVMRPGGEVLFDDRQAAGVDALDRAAALPGGWTAFGTVLALGPDSGAAMEALPEGPLDLGPGVWAAAARLRGGCGVGVRIAAVDGGRLREAGRAALARAEAALGLDAAPRR